ncbi:hypothetical protein DF3PA_70110 [Candidatus Defluviicoccus seviourii]|uniref:Uncharacterized protein n=1 Tax=Candidatus Defluviicoccus seviourii TaxID=2565273 RepID=A0A564WI78_9PROT|nr:hypothetical protein DF3PA_70110 [Candidatus Defluviicoccus seviourii]
MKCNKNVILSTKIFSLLDQELKRVLMHFGEIFLGVLIFTHLFKRPIRDEQTMWANHMLRQSTL